VRKNNQIHIKNQEQAKARSNLFKVEVIRLLVFLSFKQTNQQSRQRECLSLVLCNQPESALPDALILIDS
jgi:hypothetical protein